jgi:aspartate/glutamate racemase
VAAASKMSKELGVRVSIVSPVNVSGGKGNQSDVMEAIYGEQGIKAGFTNPKTADGERNFQLLLKQAQLMKDDLKVDAVIAGCTEIPLVFTQDRVPMLKVLNPLRSLPMR